MTLPVAITGTFCGVDLSNKAGTDILAQEPPSDPEKTPCRTSSSRYTGGSAEELTLTRRRRRLTDGRVKVPGAHLKNMAVIQTLVQRARRSAIGPSARPTLGGRAP